MATLVRAHYRAAIERVIPLAHLIPLAYERNFSSIEAIKATIKASLVAFVRRARKRLRIVNFARVAEVSHQLISSTSTSPHLADPRLDNFHRLVQLERIERASRGIYEPDLQAIKAKMIFSLGSVGQ